MAERAGGLRRYPRQRFSGDVYLLDAEGYGFVLEATDLSRGGVFLRSDVLLDPGESFLVRFRLEDGRAVNALGRVTRAHPDCRAEAPSGFAVALETLDDASSRALSSATSQSVFAARAGPS